MSAILVLGETAPSTDLKFVAYGVFIAIVAAMLALDLGVFHRKAHVVSLRESIAWSAVWLALGIAFGGLVYAAYEHKWLGLGLSTPLYNPSPTGAGDLVITGAVGGAAALGNYLTAYVVEKSLAVDNIFVIAMIFSFFAVPAKYQHRVLFWGIMGALIMRGVLIVVGGEVIMRYQWVLIIFGLLLLVTALKLALAKGHGDPSRNIVVRLAKRALPTVEFFDAQRFFTRRTVAPTYSVDPATSELVQDPAPPGTLRRAGWAMTPLFLALLMIEFADLVFAVDSIPAVFAITPDPFVVFTSNIFAILGLRSLYFCLAAMIDRFRYLKTALVAILLFVGAKLLLFATPPYLDDLGGLIGLSVEAGSPVKIPGAVSLGVVMALLGAGVLASILLKPGRRAPHPPATQDAVTAEAHTLRGESALTP